MKYNTFSEWNKKGYYVLKGEHARKRNKEGIPVFGEDQVEEGYLETFGYDHW